MQLKTVLTPSHRNLLFRIAVIAIIVFGLILRSAKYFPAFSMRGDELAVTANLLERSILDLITTPLDNEQAAPFGFILLVKTLITIFGQSEYVLRLIAFVASCISLILMQNLLTKTGGQYGNLFALTAFSLSGYLIYYSAELKPYSSDVLMCLLLVGVFYQHISEEAHARDFILLAVAGILALCFSYPAIFVMAGIGIPLFLKYWKDKQKLIWITLTGMIWAAGFLVLYFLLLRHQTQSSYLITFWDDLLSFMPMPPWREMSWFPKALSGLFFVVAGLSSSLIVVIPLYVLGLWEFWKKNGWQWTLALTIPIGLNILVSGFHKYPFHGRLILYLLPLVFIVLGKGIDLLIEQLRNRAIANLVFAVLAVLLLKPVISTANSYLFTHSYLQDDLKPILSFVQNNKQNGDIIYLYHRVGLSYSYYAPLHGLENVPVVSGQNNSSTAKNYQTELASLPRGQRIWFVFSAVSKTRIRKGVTRTRENIFSITWKKTERY